MKFRHIAASMVISASIEAALLEIESVQDAFVVENVSSETVDGIPPNSIAPYVYDGDEASIVKVILETKAAGIQSYGENVINVTDSKGRIQKIGYTRAKSKNVFVKIELDRNSLFKPESEKLITTAVVEYIGGRDEDGEQYKGLGLGMSVMRSKIIAIADNAGTDDVKVWLSDDGISYHDGNITIPAMQIADTSFDKVEIL